MWRLPGAPRPPLPPADPAVRPRQGDITSADFVRFILEEENVDTIMHFAAQTHGARRAAEPLGGPAPPRCGWPGPAPPLASAAPPAVPG